MEKGHWLIEPYLYDTALAGQYDDKGNVRRSAHAQDVSLLTEIFYGITDRITVGIMPRLGFNNVGSGSSGLHIGLGDVTVQSQWLLTKFHAGSSPTVSVLVSETLPTGKYDHLNGNSDDGFGTGSYTTTVSIYSQYYFWLRNGRILRSRLNLAYSRSSSVSIGDSSVYGTGSGFSGQAAPGDTALADSAWEYSATKNWVVAIDFIYQRTDRTLLTGNYVTPNVAAESPQVRQQTGAGHTVSIAPAVEYNWNDRLGLIAGVQLTVGGKNSSAVVIPTIAVNCYF